MKRFLPVLLVTLALTGLGQNPADDANTSEITSTASVYDQKANQLHYWGNVHLKSPGTLELRCEDFLILLGEGGSKLDQIVATTNVVLHLVQPATATRPAMTNVAYAHQATFDGVSNIVTLAKSPGGPQPRFEGPDLVAEADMIIYNRMTDRFKLVGYQRTRFKPGKLPKGGFFAPKADPAPATK